MKALLIAVLVLFAAHSAAVAGERGRGAGIHRGGGNAVHGAPRGSDRDRGINQPRYGDGGGQRSKPYSGGGNRGWSGNRGGGSYHHRGGWGYRSDDFAGGILGGIIGGAIGSIFAPEPEPDVVIIQPQVQEMQPGTPEWFAYCTNKYKSFNAETGTFTGYDGKTYPCR